MRKLLSADDRMHLLRGRSERGVGFCSLLEGLIGDINVAASFLLLSGNSITMTFILRACNVHALLLGYILCHPCVT